VIVFDDVHKAFGGRAVLRGVSLTVARGSVHFVIGESGGGKSVLVKHVVGLVRPDRGSIRYDGRELVGLSEAGFREVRRSCQMIFQSATLFDGLTLLENVAMPLRQRFGLPKREAYERARDALERVHATALGDRLPAEVGAGVRKRIAVARAIALEPRTILYDEPTTSLDPVAARRTDRLIREMADRFGITSFVVSHDLVSVHTGDRVSFLESGRVAFEGTPEELAASRDPAVRRFVHGERRLGAPGGP
jgi:phospholipid/cholesterol/gamma-HCH transport system ATP-binding protein